MRSIFEKVVVTNRGLSFGEVDQLRKDLRCESEMNDTDRTMTFYKFSGLTPNGKLNMDAAWHRYTSLTWARTRTKWWTISLQEKKVLQKIPHNFGIWLFSVVLAMKMLCWWLLVRVKHLCNASTVSHYWVKCRQHMVGHLTYKAQLPTLTDGWSSCGSQ